MILRKGSKTSCIDLQFVFFYNKNKRENKMIKYILDY